MILASVCSESPRLHADQGKITFFQAFFNSALYQKYLTECIQTVQKSSLRPGGYHRPEEKDASSCSDTSSSITQQVRILSSMAFADQHKRPSVRCIRLKWILWSQLHSPRTAGGSVSSDHFGAGSSYLDLMEDKVWISEPRKGGIPILFLWRVDFCLKKRNGNRRNSKKSLNVSETLQSVVFILCFSPACEWHIPERENIRSTHDSKVRIFFFASLRYISSIFPSSRVKIDPTLRIAGCNYCTWIRWVN